jgi:hypothetical protein
MCLVKFYRKVLVRVIITQIFKCIWGFLILFGFAQNESEAANKPNVSVQAWSEVDLVFLFWRKKWRLTVPANSKAA